MVSQTVVERKTRLDGTTVEYACQAVLVEPPARAVLRYVLDRAWTVGSLALRPGLVTIGHYWADRPYYAYHWVDGGRTVGLYFSIADRMRIARDAVQYRDLVVDVLLEPSGAVEILDEDELPPDLEPAARKTIADALEALITNGRRLAAEIERETRSVLPV